MLINNREYVKKSVLENVFLALIYELIIPQNVNY